MFDLEQLEELDRGLAEVVDRSDLVSRAARAREISKRMREKTRVKTELRLSRAAMADTK